MESARDVQQHSNLLRKELGLGYLILAQILYVAGFLVGWNLWLYIILFISAMGVMLATNISYALGLSFSWIGASRWCIAADTLTLTLGLAVVTSLGLRVGKWVQNFGAVFQLATFGALILLPLTGRARDYTPLHIAMPAIRTREGALAFSRRSSAGASSRLAEVVIEQAAETLSPPEFATACPNTYG